MLKGLIEELYAKIEAYSEELSTEMWINVDL